MDPAAQLEATEHLSRFRSRYHSAHQGWEETVLRHRAPDGTPLAPDADAEALCEQQAEATRWFRPVLPYAADLIDRARRQLDQVPAAPHHPAWHEVLDELAETAAEAGHIVRSRSTAVEQQTALWRCARTWATHGDVLRSLVDLADPREASVRGKVDLPYDERGVWEAAVRADRAEGRLAVLESWYDHTSELITLVALEDGVDVLALRGDIDSPWWYLLGCYPDEEAARAALPPAAPPGVLRPEGVDDLPPHSRLSRPEHLTHQVLASRHGSEVAELLYAVTNSQDGDLRGSLPALTDFTDACVEFTHALDTRAGRHLAIRLETVSTALHRLNTELQYIADALASTVSVLPPHRVQRPSRITQPSAASPSQRQRTATPPPPPGSDRTAAPIPRR